MHELGSVRDFSRTELEHLWLTAAGWKSAQLRGRHHRFHRIATIGTPPPTAVGIAAQVAIEALATHHLALAQHHAELDVSDLVDLTVVFTGDQAPVGAPAVRVGSDVDAVIDTLAIALAHLLGHGTWRNAQVDVRELPAGLAAQFYALADYFPLTILTDHPAANAPVQVGSVQVVAAGAKPASASGIRAADNTRAHTSTITTTQPTLALLAATWCGLLEVIGTADN